MNNTATESIPTVDEAKAELEAYEVTMHEFGHGEKFVGKIAEFEAMRAMWAALDEKVDVADDRAAKSAVAAAEAKNESDHAEVIKARELLPAALDGYQKAADHYSQLLSAADAARDTERQSDETLERLKSRAVAPKESRSAPDLLDLDIKFLARTLLASQQKDARYTYTIGGVTIGTNDSVTAEKLQHINRTHPDKRAAIIRALRGY